MLRRSRNIGGLLADRLTGGGTDRGTHGYKMGNQVFYNTEGEEGKKVYAYSIGNFPTQRCLEQIRNDIIDLFNRQFIFWQRFQKC